MKRYIFFAILVFLTTALSAQLSDSLELSIRYYDKAIYFTESTVQIKLELYNNSSQAVRFKMADSKYFSVDFDVRSVSNVRADYARSYIIARGATSPVFFREVSLEPGERFGFVETLNDFVIMPPPGSYVIRTEFYPELFRGENTESIVSNALTMIVHPGATDSTETVAMDIETSRILGQAALPPDEVVSFILRARQHEEWENFLLYLDLERLYIRTTASANAYQRLSDAERRRVLGMYRDELSRAETEDEILLVPTSFEIVKTSYTPSDASVLVIERFDYPGFTEVKEYTYYLDRKDRIWMIYDYAVRNLGTE